MIKFINKKNVNRTWTLLLCLIFIVSCGTERSEIYKVIVVYETMDDVFNDFAVQTVINPETSEENGLYKFQPVFLDTFRKCQYEIRDDTIAINFERSIEGDSCGFEIFQDKVSPFYQCSFCEKGFFYGGDGKDLNNYIDVLHLKLDTTKVKKDQLNLKFFWKYHYALSLGKKEYSSYSIIEAECNCFPSGRRMK